MCKPVIGISCDTQTVLAGNGNAHTNQAVFSAYLHYVTRVLEFQCVLVPAGEMHEEDAHNLLERLDGVLLTGSPSNVTLRISDGQLHETQIVGTGDVARDRATLALVAGAAGTGVPLLGICRGMQEINVALGGTLHQELHALPGRLDHRSDKTVPHAERYGPRHGFKPLADSWIGARLAALGVSPDTEIPVNSLHGQGIDRLGCGLDVEGVAEDGTIEAVRMRDGAGFVYGVQWHLERHHDTCVLNTVISQAFRSACLARSARR